ncbi:MAG: short-chain dehydrogenase [Cyanobium sp. CACIAM 14]|nr:MAG: short-chain dehydrogenase [Cyanobium sp. CACIAM 14]
MPKTLAGTVALVTGASRGIGRGIAVGLGEAGATVYITGRSLEAAGSSDPVGGSLLETAAEVEAAGGVCVPVAVDHRDDAQVRALFARIAEERDGRLDVLVNNVYGGLRALRRNAGKPFWLADPGLWDACNDAGLRSHYIASVQAAALMAARGRGLICTISSWGGLGPLFGVAYGTGKSACDRMAAEMAAELRPHGVASIALWPGIVGTEHISAFVQEQAAAGSGDPVLAGMGSRFNWETPLLSGRVIAALATDPGMMRQSGKVRIVAELAARYGLLQEDGMRPVSLRSLRFLLPFLQPRLQSAARWIPDLRIPWWLMLLTALRAPRL